MALITNQSGHSAHQYFYTPYGRRLDNNGKLPDNIMLSDSSNFTGPHNQYTLTGKPLDAESGLTYFGARYYDAANGAWLTRDPLGRNRYLFNRANPLSFIDPTGSAAVIDTGGGGGPGGCVISNHPWLCPPPTGGGSNPPPSGGGNPPPTGGGGNDPDPGGDIPGPWEPYFPPAPPPPPLSNGPSVFGSIQLGNWLPRATQQWVDNLGRSFASSKFLMESSMAARNMTPMMMGMVQSKLLDPNPSPLNPLAGVNRSILNIGSAVSAYQSGERRAGILYAKTVGANGLVNAINSYQSGERRVGLLALQALDARNALSAVNAYQSGERRPLALAAHWTGVTNALIGAANFNTQWHADARTVFLGGSPWYDRLPAAARMGSTAMTVSGVVTGGWMAIRQPVITKLGGNPQGFFGSNIGESNEGGALLRRCLLKQRGSRSVDSLIWGIEGGGFAVARPEGQFPIFGYIITY